MLFDRPLGVELPSLRRPREGMVGLGASERGKGGTLGRGRLGCALEKVNASCATADASLEARPGSVSSNACARVSEADAVSDDEAWLVLADEGVVAAVALGIREYAVMILGVVLEFGAGIGLDTPPLGAGIDDPKERRGICERGVTGVSAPTFPASESRALAVFTWLSSTLP